MPKRDMLINYVPGEECRIAITEDDRLEELYTERFSAELHVGNIYRGKVTNVEPAIQAAFVDFGIGRNGFLHITDVHPRYFRGEEADTTEQVGRKTPRRDRPPIQQCLRRGQEILVQVLKEGIGSKGPTVTSYLSLPGKFLVMMPHMERHGVSRKIDDPERRREAHRILDELNPPEGFGFIVRTAGFGRPKTDMKRDLNFLLRVWKEIEKRMDSGSGPAELFAESDLVIRTLRDVMGPEVDRIIVDDRTAALRAKQFLRLATPRGGTRVIHYKGSIPLLDAFGVERQIQQVNDRNVPLPSGGSLVFDATEALVAIDVNSGKFRDNKDAEQTAYRTNLEAVDEVARQLRLRDLGGLVVLDLIDMYPIRNRQEVEKRFRENLKNDRARTKILKISELGLLEMTRQRMRPSLKKSVYTPCPSCNGTGHVLSVESTVLEAIRRIAIAFNHPRIGMLEMTASAPVLATLLNRKRMSLTDLEQSTGKTVRFQVSTDPSPDLLKLQAFDFMGNAVELNESLRLQPPAFTDEDQIQNADLDDLGASIEMEDENDPGENTELEGGIDEPVLPGEAASPDGQKKRRRRRRRRGGGGRPPEAGAPDDAIAHAKSPEHSSEPETDHAADSSEAPTTPADTASAPVGPDGLPRKKRRRRRRRKSGGGDPSAGPVAEQVNNAEPALAEIQPPSASPSESSAGDDSDDAPKKKRRRRRRRGGGGGQLLNPDASASDAPPASVPMETLP